MSYRFVKVVGLGRTGCILLGSLGLLVGCDGSGPIGSLDAGVSTNAQRPGVGEDSTKDTSGSADTDVLSVSVDYQPGSTSDGQLSVALDRSDAGEELTLAPDVTSESPDTSEPSAPATSTVGNGTPDELPTSDEATYVDTPDTSTAPLPSTDSPSTSEPVAPTSSTEPPSTDSLSTSEPTLSTSEPTLSTSEPTPSTDSPSTDSPSTSEPTPSTDSPSTSEPVAPTSSTEPPSTGETSSETTEVPIPPFPGQLTGVASWIDVPGYFQVSVPNVRQFTAQWSLVEVPRASRLTTADLVDPNAPLTRFTPDASGSYTARVNLTVDNYEHVAEVSVKVVAVDVAFAATEINGEPTDYPPYYRSHQMLSTEPGSPPREVGCSFKSDWYSWSRDFQASWQPTVAFRYPRAPGEQTVFAYRMESSAGENNPISSTHVAGPDSDCANRRPGDMELATSPAFDGDGKSLLYISGVLYTGLSTIPAIKRAELGAPEGKTLLEPLDPYGVTWWGGGKGGILWSGAVDSWDRYGVGLLDTSHADLGWSPHCGNASSILEEIEAGADFFIGYVAGRWWHYPFSVDGRFTFNCKLAQPLFQALPQPERIHDVAVAPDGRTIAFIDERYDEQKQLVVSLRVGPVETLLTGDFKGWIAEVLPPLRQYSGLQWIAGSEQLAFTEFLVDYVPRLEDYVPYEAAIWRVNRDGSRRTEMLRVKSEKSQYRVVNTGLLPRVQLN